MFAIKLAATGAASFGGALLVGVIAMTGKQVKQSGEELVQLEHAIDSLRTAVAQTMPARGLAQRPNVPTDFNEDIEVPTVDKSVFIDPLASVLGHVQLGKNVYVAPFASIRGDEGQPIFVGDGSNIQDGVVIHALETIKEGTPVAGRTYTVAGRDYAVYVGKRVSMAHQALVHGPAKIDDNVFVGMQAMVFKASIGEGAVIEPGAKVIGVSVPPHRYVSAGTTLTDQAVADKLPMITESYPFRTLNDAVVHVNTSFAAGYSALAREAEETAVGTGDHEAEGTKKDAKPAAKKEAKAETKKPSHGEEKKH